MSLLLYMGALVVASIILVKAVNLFANSTSNIARVLKISEFTISFLLVAIATSLPETLVGITSAIKKTPLLTYGNVVGANVTLLTLTTAIPVLLGNTISTRHIINSRDVYYSTFFAFLPIFLIGDGGLTRIDGVILISAYAFYMFTILKRSTGLERFLGEFKEINMLKEFLKFGAAVSLLLLASRVIVFSAMEMNTLLGWTLGFVGLTIASLGTSLPELAFCVKSARAGETDKVLGNVIGSVVANSNFVLGITSVIYPIHIKGTNFGISTIVFLIFALLIFLNFTKSKEKLDRKEGLVMLFFYITFIVVEYYLQGTI